MVSGNFQINLKASSGNAIVEALSVPKIVDTEIAPYQEDYHILLDNFILEACDLASNVTAIASAPMPNIDTLSDTKAQQAAKTHQIWESYPKVGVQLYLDIGNGIWQKQGQPIVVQNVPVQLPFGIIQPYLNSKANLKLLNKKGRLGAQIISSVGWTQLAGNDEIQIKGDWRFSYTLEKKFTKPISSWFPISINLRTGIPSIVRPKNKNRRSLILTNDGDCKIYIYFGDESILAEGIGLPLNPDDTVSFLENENYIDSKISAIAIGGDSILAGMEGTI